MDFSVPAGPAGAKNRPRVAAIAHTRIMATERGGRPQYPKGGPAERYGQARPEKDAAGGISAPT